MTFEDIIVGVGMIEEGIIVFRGLDGDENESRDVPAQHLWIDTGVVAFNIAPLLKFSQPVADRRQRKADEGSKVIAPCSCVLLENFQDFGIDVIQRRDGFLTNQGQRWVYAN